MTTAGVGAYKQDGQVQEKHIKLEQAIDELRSAVNSLELLHERMTGEGRPTEPKNVSPAVKPTLQHVLDSAPDEVAICTKRLYELKERMAQVLF